MLGLTRLQSVLHLQVRLKSVVDYITEVLSHTVKERCLREAVAAACAAAAGKLRPEAAEHLQLLQENGAAVTADILRLHLQGAVPHLQADASFKVCAIALPAPAVLAARSMHCPRCHILKRQ